MFAPTPSRSRRQPGSASCRRGFPSRATAPSPTSAGCATIRSRSSSNGSTGGSPEGEAADRPRDSEVARGLATRPAGSDPVAAGAVSAPGCRLGCLPQLRDPGAGRGDALRARDRIPCRQSGKSSPRERRRRSLPGVAKDRSIRSGARVRGHARRSGAERVWLVAGEGAVHGTGRPGLVARTRQRPRHSTAPAADRRAGSGPAQPSACSFRTRRRLASRWRSNWNRRRSIFPPARPTTRSTTATCSPPTSICSASIPTRTTWRSRWKESPGFPTAA